MRRYLIYFPLLFLTVSCEIIEEDISGRAVTTIAPADDAEVPAGETLFRWRAVDRATGYELCVATEGRIVADTLLAADTLGLARSYGCRLTLEAGQKEPLRTFRRVFRPRRLCAVGGGIARARASCSPPQGAAANGRQRRALSNRRNKTASG